MKDAPRPVTPEATPRGPALGGDERGIRRPPRMPARQGSNGVSPSTMSVEVAFVDCPLLACRHTSTLGPYISIGGSRPSKER